MRFLSSTTLATGLRSRLFLAAFATVLTISLAPQAHAAPCPQSATDPSVTICTPANGATVNSPISIVAGTNSSSAVTLMQIYVDGVKKYEITNASQLSTSVDMVAGTRRVTVQAKNAAGTIFKQTISINVGGTPPPPPPGGLSNIKHIFFMLQENRSFDNYFGKLGEYRQAQGLSGLDGLPAGAKGLTKSGQFVPAYHYETVCTENLSPGWNESHYDINGGKMDRFPFTTAGSIPSTIDPQATRAMGYYDETDLPYYYDLATQFATSDRFFASMLGPTIPNRMYMFTGTSFGHIRPSDPVPAGGWTQKTIFQALDEAGVSWRYYYQDNSVFLAQFSIWAKDQGKVYNISKYYTDIQTPSTLPSVIFIERAGQLGLDEHPLNNVQRGADSVRTIIKKLQESPTWATSAFIWTFDEGGGLYDHVVPPAVVKPDTIAPMLKSTDIKADFNQMGFRVPFILVSPWVKPHYVSHTPMEFGSILKLIEKRFMPNAQPLTARDANAPDMTEFFDFTTPHWLTPPPAKFQPIDGICNKNLQKAPGW